MSYQGFAITDTSKWSDAKKIEFKPRTLGGKDVEVKVDHCGICGSDIHTVTGGWGGTVVPVIPGHEIIGTVTKVGPEVTLHKVGDRVGVGAQIDSCFNCDRCANGHENYCEHSLSTYNDEKDGEISYGGYANFVTANEHFVFNVPEKLDSAEYAPLFCAGLTVYAPLRNNIKAGDHVGIVGIGGLGHLAIQFAKALGATVYALSRGEKKKQDALKLGADYYIDTTVENWSKPYKFKLDFVLSCANSSKGFTNDYFEILKVFGKLNSVGLPEEPIPISALSFLGNGVSFGATHLGNREEMLEMLDVVVKHDVKPWCDLLPISEENVKKGLERTERGDVKYRITLTNFAEGFK
ncbi:NADP-dependent alcohol dehydrogenase 6 [[Candida] jaroonii]|uniref:NADP-dependent alcohol dehydrogenase 6 n=1 Tax=[Candida] jaroonii TaxID=467808 RepID=A0ACA9Y5U3_9ASCO|nr:NADP-dependent alcohol dehydrogenase 6 [[Candida] jaroonii]